ncbi:ATP-binding protein [Sphingomonas sp. Leaf205]|uniref:ATP-binding protein n=1 Tax=Sphingomonas sp. Leaf205 TaxID=2876551 RepID=UPI001E41BCBF|nr:ATP-binding protein [Sphingomonas sp. Leaf205]
MEINLFNLGGLNFSGLKVEANLGPRRSPASSSLAVSLRALNASPSILACLSWHTRTSRFVGRQTELNALTAWCDHPANLSLKFVHGEGGAGKSRLAAELALILRQRGWSAGFLSPDNQETVLNEGGKGTLIVVDYPEEGAALLKAFLKRLRAVETETKLRVLCLSRQMPQQWDQVFTEAGTTDFVDNDPVVLSGVTKAAAYDMFSSAMEEIAGNLDSIPKPIAVAMFDEWYDGDQFHSNPLYIVAAAARAAFMPEEPALSYAGKDTIRALARKEQDRLRRLARARDLPPQAFIEIAAGALLQDGLSRADLSRFTKSLQTPFSLSLSDEALDSISRTDDAGFIHFDMPDILGACFVAEAFRDCENASDLLWLSSTIRPAPLERFARFASDAQLIMGDGGRAILEAAIANLQIDERFTTYLHGIGLRREQALDPVLWPLWTAIHIRHSETADNPLLIVSSLCNASVGLSNNGEHAVALEKLERARSLLRTVSADPRLKQQEMANISLNMGRALASSGQCARAITVLQEAIKHAGRAAKTARSDPQSFFYWEAQDTIALAYDNMSRAWGLLGEKARSIHFARRACALADRKRAMTSHPPTWSELNFRINLTSALQVSGDTAEALSLLEQAEADIRSRLPVGRTDFALTMNLHHQCSFANSNYGKEDLPIERWYAILDRLEEAITGADRMLAASPINMIKLAVTARIIRADIYMKLGDLSAWAESQGSVYKLLVRHRIRIDLGHGLASAAAILVALLPIDEAETCFSNAFGVDDAVRAAWQSGKEAAIERPLRRLGDLWHVGEEGSPFIVL